MITWPEINLPPINLWSAPKMADITIMLSDGEKITLTVEKAKELQAQLNNIFPVMPELHYPKPLDWKPPYIVTS
ncbi:MAG: hypothetical protein KGI54_17960 [Pseudomonadota bacterium]|nr:hypothetical protein [Pseudomonadota bacterium]